MRLTLYNSCNHGGFSMPNAWKRADKTARKNYENLNFGDCFGVYVQVYAWVYVYVYRLRFSRLLRLLISASCGALPVRRTKHRSSGRSGLA